MSFWSDIRKAVSDRARQGGGREIALATPQQAPEPPRDQTDGWFGPGQPPDPSAPPSVAGRRNDYPTGINTIQSPRPYEPVTYSELRALADGYDLLRLVIETRKDQISRLKWNFSPIEDKVKMEDGSDLAARAKKYQELFRRPDRDQFWGDWIRSVLEDLLVIDAPTIHVRRTLGGDVYSLDQIDGATIKRIVDDGGRTPEPPFAAYQQVLKGYPAVNYSKEDLVYRPRNLRVHKIYGYSPVEQILMTVNIALRRQMWQLAYFTHGNIPDSLIGVPATWTPDQIKQFQDWFDSLLMGNTQDRRSARFVPGEVAKSYVPTKEAEIFGGAEEWMARVVCFCFGISHQSLVKEVNRATAETAADSSITDGMAPIMSWVKGAADSILIDQFGETELEFAWLDEKELDPKTQSEIHKNQVGRIKCINEARADLGLDPDPSPEADMLGSFASDGTFVPLSAEKRDDASPTADVAAEAGGDEGSDADKLLLASAQKMLRVPPVSPLRPAAARIRRAMHRSLAPVLAELGQSVAAQVAEGLESAGVHKAAEVDLSTLTDEELDDLLDSLMESVNTTTILDRVIVAAATYMEDMFDDTGRTAIARLGVSEVEDLFERVNVRAVEYATDRAAELVGRRILEDGSIVDNPDARWAISEATRDSVRDTIAGGLRENIGSDAITEALMDSYAFSDSRAETISRTEIAMANSEGAMQGYREAMSVGVSLRKEWILGPNPCPVCIENSEAGVLDIDEEFPSGDQNTPAHPNCVCAVIAVQEE